MTTTSSRPTYTPAQLSTYFTHISLPQTSQLLAQQTPTNLHHHPDHALAFLTQLQKYHLAAVPFESLQLHYSPHHTISLDPESLFEKVVGRKRGRGGYCMENNCFFGTVLRSLGFEVCSAGARVGKGEGGSGLDGWHGWGHMVNLVTLGGDGDGGRRKYMLDVGFGGPGPVQPMLLGAEDAATTAAAHVWQIAPAESRLVRENIPENTDREQKLWQYQHRIDAQSEWQAIYCFTELEFLPEDYEVMNFWASQSPKSWFTYCVVAVKMIREGDEVVGTLILQGGEVKRRVNGKTEHLRTCKTEEERVRALEEVFELRLTDEEKRGIGGMVTELKG